MSQNDQTIANQAGGPFRADLNSALQALASCSSGPTAPSTTYQFQLWADTTTGKLKIRNAANTAWHEVGALDTDFLGLVKADAATNFSAVVSMISATLRTGKGANIASAATCNIWSADGNLVHVTGTTGITSFGTAGQAGEWRLVVFDGALTLTDGANLNTPFGLSVTTAAGDIALVVADTTTLHRIVWISSKSGNLKIPGDFFKGSNNLTATEQTLSDGATINWNVANGPCAKVTIAGNRTMAAPTSLQSGKTYMLRVIQDGTGSRLITWNSVFKWPGASAPVLSTGAGDIDLLGFYCDGTNLYGGISKDFG